MIAVKYRAKNLFIANVAATSYEAELARSALSASWRKLFNEMLWQAHNARPDETSGDGDVGRELRSQWAAALLEFLAIVELLNLITEVNRTWERERERWCYIYVRLTFAPSPAPATIELAVRIVEYVRRERPRLNREAMTRRNNNEISFSLSGGARSDGAGFKRYESFARNFSQGSTREFRAALWTETGEWYSLPAA